MYYLDFAYFCLLAVLFLLLSLGSIFYLRTLFFWLISSTATMDKVILDRISHLKSVYGLIMHSILAMIIVASLSLTLYYSGDNFEANNWLASFVLNLFDANAVFIIGLLLWSLCLIRSAFFYIKESKGAWTIVKREMMLPGIVFCFLLIGTVVVNTLIISDMKVYKPVIYLYPEKTTDVTVELDYDGDLIADYPNYDTTIGGWRVTAQPDSTLINHADGREYSYLFWEGESREPGEWDLSTGFVVKGVDTREFLQAKLAEIGLTPREYNEFIVYWYPLMKDNPYNLIHFADEEYTRIAPLTVTPTPDALLRVFMVYRPLRQPVEVIPQLLKSFTRTGFTVVEWGGARAI